MSDFLGNLLERARGKSAAVRPVAAVYGDDRAESIEVVEEEEHEDAHRRGPSPAPAQETSEPPRPGAGARPSPAVSPAPPAASTEPNDPVQLVVEGRSEPLEGSPIQPVQAPQTPPAPQTDVPRTRRAAGRPRSELPVDSPPAAPAVAPPTVVADPAHDRFRPDEEHRPLVPLRPAEAPKPRRAAGPRPPQTLPKVAPDVPASEIRERLVAAAEPAEEPATIHVSIGRVELRAPASAPASPAARARTAETVPRRLPARARSEASMSNPLAITAVTAAFGQLLKKAIGEAGVAGAKVRLEPPDPNLALSDPLLNLFLYQVNAHGPLRSEDARSATGKDELLRPSVLALNLHYLLTAYGKGGTTATGGNQLEAQHLLAHAMSFVNDNSMLTRDHVRDAIDAYSAGPSRPTPAFPAPTSTVRSSS